jgi:hypothetical protein
MKVELQKDTISKILKNTTNGGFNVPSASENGKAAWEAQKNDIEYQELQLKSIQDAIRSFGAPNQAGLNLIPEAAAAAIAPAATAQLQSIVFMHEDNKMAPKNWTLGGGDDKSMHYATKLYFLGDPRNKVSPIRGRSATELNLIGTSKKLQQNKSKTLKRTKAAVLGWASWAEMEDPTAYDTFKTNPNVLTLNNVFKKTFPTFKRKLIELQPTTTTSGRKRSKFNLNNASAVSISQKMGSRNEGYMKFLVDKGKVEIPVGKGKATKWLVDLPAPSLIMRRVQVADASPIIPPISFVNKSSNFSLSSASSSSSSSSGAIAL